MYLGGLLFLQLLNSVHIHSMRHGVLRVSPLRLGTFPKKARHEVGLLTIESRFSMVFVFVLMLVFAARAVPVAIIAQVVADRATNGAA